MKVRIRNNKLLNLLKEKEINNMKEFHIGDRVIDIESNKGGTYRGFSVGNHLPLVEFDGENKFTELSSNLELIETN
jgi:hypothetical protein